MDDELRARFRLYYQGRHDPDDAFYWITHPTSPGPSSTPPPQQIYLDAAAQLDAEGLSDAAAALVKVGVEALAADRRLALDALALAQEALEE